MSRWNFDRKQILYNRLHKTSVWFLVGATIILSSLLGQRSYSVIKNKREQEKLYEQEELPSKSD